MEIRILVTDLEQAIAKEFRYIPCDKKRKEEISKELAEYVRSKNKVLIEANVFNSKNKSVLRFSVDIPNTKDNELINAFIILDDLFS